MGCKGGGSKTHVRELKGLCLHDVFPLSAQNVLSPRYALNIPLTQRAEVSKRPFQVGGTWVASA